MAGRETDAHVVCWELDRTERRTQCESDPRLQDAEPQTKSLDCALQRYTITADGRLLQHPGGGLFDEPPRFPTLERDVELPIHGDIDMHESWSP